MLAAAQCCRVVKDGAYWAEILDALLLKLRSSALVFEIDLLSLSNIKPNNPMRWVKAHVL